MGWVFNKDKANVKYLGYILYVSDEVKLFASH